MRTDTQEMTKATQRGIEHCLDCYAACVRTAQHCLERGGKQSDPGFLRLLHDCADICRTSAAFMLRSSRFHGRTCLLCAEVCRTCERACLEMADDPTMKACADSCRICAGSCERMAKMAA